MLGGPALNRKGIEEARFAVVFAGGAVVDLGLNGNSEKCIIRILSITSFWEALVAVAVAVFRPCVGFEGEFNALSRDGCVFLT